MVRVPLSVAEKNIYLKNANVRTIIIIIITELEFHIKCTFLFFFFHFWPIARIQRIQSSCTAFDAYTNYNFQFAFVGHFQALFLTHPTVFTIFNESRTGIKKNIAFHRVRELAFDRFVKNKHVSSETVWVKSF